MPVNRTRTFLSFGSTTRLAVVAGAVLACSAAALGQPVVVSVRKQGEEVVIDVSARVATKVENVWAVMTDYEHMAEYLSALKTSQVLSRKGNELEVAQSGEAHRGFLHFSFATVRAVELLEDKEIRSHLIRGDFKSYEFTTRIEAETGGMVSIVHHGQYVPNAWVPPVIGPELIETETRKQFNELIAEMLRRQSGAPRVPMVK